MYVRDRMIDDIIKEKIKSEKIIIPQKINDQVNNTMKLLPKRQNKFINQGIAIAAILLVSFITVININPSSATNVPILKSVFQFFNQNQYVEFSTKHNSSTIDKGYTVNINEIAVDENYLVLGYTVESLTSFSNISDISLWGTLKLNGKELKNSLMNISNSELVNENTFAGYQVYYVGRENLQNQFTLDFEINRIDSTEGNWAFRFEVSKGNTDKVSTIIDYNDILSFAGKEIELEKVMFSAFSNTIQLSSKYDPENQGFPFFTLLDDQNRALPSEKIYGRKMENSYKYDMHFYRGKSIPESLKLVSYTLNPDYDLNPLKLQTESALDFPIVLSPSKNTNIVVNNLTFNETNTMLSYYIEGFYPFNHTITLVLQDEKGNTIYPLEQGYAIDKQTNDLVLKFPPLDKNKAYKIGTPISLFEDVTILTEHIIEIPLRDLK